MNILQVVSSIEAEAAGPSYTVPRLSQSLAGLGHYVTLMSLGEPGENTEGRLRRLTFRRDRVGLPGLGRLGFSGNMHRALGGEDGKLADVLHVHGLWMMPNVYPAWAAKRHDKPLVLAPRGMLGKASLRFSTNVKRLFWMWRQGNAARTVACFHATCEEEYNDIRRYGLMQPVAIIPNGIDVPELSEEIQPATQPTILSLGRLHPKKNISELITAFAGVEQEFPGWQLRIVGPDEGGHVNRLKRLVNDLQVANVSISGPVFGKEKEQMLQQAELFVLPTLNENFGMTVAESLAVGTPVISSKGAPWQGLEENGCGWWVEHGVDALADALTEAMSLSPEARAGMGMQGREWMIRDFSWQVIAERMAAVYEWLIEDGDAPEWVRVE
jgi:glycosyltransferase involved in cell wall biosynthesis